MNQKMNIPFVDLIRQHKDLQAGMMNALKKVLNHGEFILGKSVEEFEKKISNYLGVQYCIGVGNGTDALYLSLKSLGIGKGDEVITSPNSYLSSASSIILTGAKPIFVDVAEDMNIDTNKIKEKINVNTKAIIVVHLTGKPANIEEIIKITKNKNISIIEDAAQAIGAEIYNRKVGSFGELGCFSMHPLKNLNAIGDAGIITTNNKNLYDYLLKARNHGHPSRDQCDFISHNMRLDALQAEFLSFKLDYLENLIKKRRKNASIYNENLKNYVTIPIENLNCKSVYHTYIIQSDRRSELQKYLQLNGIETKIHYPTPIPFLKAFSKYNIRKTNLPNAVKQSKKILSLPVAEYLSNNEINYVSKKIIEFFN
jgi:dTDP-4-amino-4,6-dideoxygalactose transaminase